MPTKVKVHAAFDQWAQSSPEIAEVVEYLSDDDWIGNYPNHFLSSLADQLDRYKVLSERQVDAALRTIHKRKAAAQHAAERAAQPAAQDSGEKVAPLGVYRLDGEVYVVKRSRTNPDRRYAMRMVDSPPRMTETGMKADFEFEFASGIVWRLTDSDRLPEVEAQDLMTKYGRCIVCRHPLKQYKSLERMMGRTCYRRMHGLE